ncbi:AraC family transcriptional regulator [Chitinophaga sp. sic0106]|uniref:helix-turn-helix domain-containing protein n=1 Tax=Chitinophaga sp. sic0106 TaxID=2854785 RepID=UPI001C45D750|nr:AraC family transcriptional regulator [Chitinophaga sp. sic0106]MBV7530736.1 AraC family transcriptional regulator [Chitinophaga sp. sic0106]
MRSSVKIFSNFEYKRQFLPGISRQVLLNDAQLQVYRIEQYLRDIVIPVLPYRTSFNFLIFVTKGHIVQQLETDSHRLAANSLLLIRQGAITATLEISKDAAGFFVVFENEVVENLALHGQLFNFFFVSPFVQVPPQAVKWLSSLIILLEEELALKNSSLDVAIGLFRPMLQKIMVAAGEQRPKRSRTLELALHFRELVQQHHLQQKQVAFYAAELNISENYLNKTVKQATGKPPKQWINEVNILHSQILLLDSSRDISSVAFELNFQSPNYFARLFKQVTGETPTQYRNRAAVI